MSKRLKSSHWLDAYRSRLVAKLIPYYVVKKGDPDAGTLFIRVNDKDLYVPQYDYDADQRVWQIVASDAQIEDYLKQQEKFDPDYWLLDVEAGGEKLLFVDGL